MTWRDRLRGRRPPPALADRATVAAGQVGRIARAGRGGLPAALAHALRRRRVADEDDEASSSAERAPVDLLRAELARELARAVERSDERGEGSRAGH